MKIKLNFAVALSHDPQLLILDEATSGLDPVMRDDMLDILLDFVQDESKSVLFSSHITSDLEKIADYVAFLHKGELIFCKKKDDLIYHYGLVHCKTAEFEKIEKSDILAYRKQDFEWQVLVENREAAVKKYKNTVVDHATIDEIMLLFIRGERI
jgi:ABC-2 type transport system ATP-binding protein